MKPQIFLVGLAAISATAAPPPVDPNHPSTNIAIGDSIPVTAAALTMLEKRDECNTCRRNCKLKQAFWPWPFLPWRMKKCNKRCRPTCEAFGQDKDSHKHKNTKTTKKTEKTEKTEESKDNDDKDDAVVEQAVYARDGDKADVDAMMGVAMAEGDLDKDFEKAFVDYFGRKLSEKERSDMQMLD